MRQLPLFHQFTPDELAFVSKSKIGQQTFAPRQPVIGASSPHDEMFTLLSGWAYRFKTLPNGERQILDFLLPGDLIGLQAPMLGRLRHGVIALTEATVCQIAGRTADTILKTQPDLAAALVRTLLLDDERADRRLLMLGRQRPTARLAYLFLELFERLEQRGAVQGASCSLPITYEHMRDALGLSRSQLARSLAEVRERGWARFGSERLELLDRTAMSSFANYELSQEAEQRAMI